MGRTAAMSIAQRVITEAWYGAIRLYEDALVLFWSGMSRCGFRCPHPVATGQVVWPPRDGSAVTDLRCKACGRLLGTVTTRRREDH